MATAPPSNASGSAPRTARGLDFERLLVFLGVASVFVGLSFLAGFDYSVLLEDPPFLVLVALGWIGAALLVWRQRPWTYLTAGILVAVFPLMVTAVFGIFVLMSPLSGLAWVGVLFLLLGLVLALTGGIRGFARTRKGRPLLGAGAGWRTGLGLAMLAIVALAVGAGATSMWMTAALRDSPLSSSGYDFAPDASVGLTAEGFKFSDQDLEIQRGTITEIVIENKDGEYHDFTYTLDGKTYVHPILAGSTTKFLVRFDEPGEIKFRCQPHSGGYDDDPSESMVGRMTVA